MVAHGCEGPEERRSYGTVCMARRIAGGQGRHAIFHPKCVAAPDIVCFWPNSDVSRYPLLRCNQDHSGRGITDPNNVATNAAPHAHASASITRLIAGCSGFSTFTQYFDRPA